MVPTNFNPVSQRKSEGLGVVPTHFPSPLAQKMVPGNLRGAVSGTIKPLVSGAVSGTMKPLVSGADSAQAFVLGADRMVKQASRIDHLQ